MVLALCAAGFAFSACRGPRRNTAVYEKSADAPTRFEAGPMAGLKRARAALDAGDGASALEILSSPPLDASRDFGVLRLRQEAQIAAAGGAVAKVEESAMALAQSEPSVSSLLLWARVCSDDESALAAIEHALSLDPRDAWAHYALGHRRARAGDWVGASDAVERALAFDPGHRAARRLEAAILARGGSAKEAADALAVWLEATLDDPFVSARERVSAQLDLAHVLLLRGDAKGAIELLRALPDGERDALVGACLTAASEQALGHPQAALAAARTASASDPHALTPLVQIAILQQYDLRDRAAARVAWQALLDATRGATELASLVQGLRARIALERDAARPAETAPL